MKAFKTLTDDETTFCDTAHTSISEFLDTLNKLDLISTKTNSSIRYRQIATMVDQFIIPRMYNGQKRKSNELSTMQHT